MAISALLAACSAAAQNTASVEQIATEPPSLDVAAPAPAVAEPTSHAAHAEAAVSCDVRARRTADGVVIQARAFADRDIDGEYDLVITKSGGGNSSDISQSGPLTLAAGSAATLGENEISLERGARVRAVLTLRDASGEICRRSFRL
jgi:hypothetical protein